MIMVLESESERERERERGILEEWAHDRLFTLRICPWAINHLLRVAQSRLHYAKSSEIP